MAAIPKTSNGRHDARYRSPDGTEHPALRGKGIPRAAPGPATTDETAAG